MSGVNHDYKTIFIHVPRTAGVSMKVYPFIYGGGHDTMAQMKLRVEKEMWDTYFKFAFVRHPLDRFVSLYFSLIERPYIHQNILTQKIIDFMESIPFTEFCLKLSSFGAREFDLFKPQIKFFDSGEKLDFIGKFENLQEDFDYICQVVGYPPSKLPYLNYSKHEPYINYYTKEAAEAIIDFYWADFVKFDYQVPKFAWQL